MCSSQNVKTRLMGALLCSSNWLWLTDYWWWWWWWWCTVVFVDMVTLTSRVRASLVIVAATQRLIVNRSERAAATATFVPLPPARPAPVISCRCRLSPLCRRRGFVGARKLTDEWNDLTSPLCVLTSSRRVMKPTVLGHVTLSRCTWNASHAVQIIATIMQLAGIRSEHCTASELVARFARSLLPAVKKHAWFYYGFRFSDRTRISSAAEQIIYD